VSPAFGGPTETKKARHRRCFKPPSKNPGDHRHVRIWASRMYVLCRFDARKNVSTEPAFSEGAGAFSSGGGGGVDGGGGAPPHSGTANRTRSTSLGALVVSHARPRRDFRASQRCRVLGREQGPCFRCGVLTTDRSAHHDKFRQLDHHERPATSYSHRSDRARHLTGASCRRTPAASLPISENRGARKKRRGGWAAPSDRPPIGSVWKLFSIPACLKARVPFPSTTASLPSLVSGRSGRAIFRCCARPATVLRVGGSAAGWDRGTAPQRRR